MKLEIGKIYMTRGLHTVKIVERIGEYYIDHCGRAFFIDGVPTSDGVSSAFRIVGEI